MWNQYLLIHEKKDYQNFQLDHMFYLVNQTAMIQKSSNMDNFHLY